MSCSFRGSIHIVLDWTLSVIENSIEPDTVFTCIHPASNCNVMSNLLLSMWINGMYGWLWAMNLFTSCSVLPRVSNFNALRAPRVLEDCRQDHSKHSALGASQSQPKMGFPRQTFRTPLWRNHHFCGRQPHLQNPRETRIVANHAHRVNTSKWFPTFAFATNDAWLRSKIERNFVYTKIQMNRFIIFMRRKVKKVERLPQITFNLLVNVVLWAAWNVFKTFQPFCQQSAQHFRP